jgi:hypothetical protein
VPGATFGADAGNRHSEIFGGGELDKQLWNLEGTGDAKPAALRGERLPMSIPSSRIVPLSGLR